MPKQSCHGCKYLEVREGERRVRNRMYPCTAPLPAIPVLPDSVAHYERDSLARMWAARRYSCPNYGETCHAFVKREK